MEGLIPLLTLKGAVMSRCWYCGAELRWQSDFNYDEVFGEGEGIVTYLTCSECGAEVQYSLRTDDEDEVN
jgi:DNA-directed RNA polymerase subunit RPC12/RpoP